MIIDFQVILERRAEIDARLANSGDDNFSLEDLDSEKKILISGKKKRLAFLDMLLFAAKGDASITTNDIQEEVDTFMFEVRWLHQID